LSLLRRSQSLPVTMARLPPRSMFIVALLDGASWPAPKPAGRRVPYRKKERLSCVYPGIG
jgi:hypothetical protein